VDISGQTWMKNVEGVWKNVIHAVG